MDDQERTEVRWRRAAAYVLCRDELDRILLTRFAAPDHPENGWWTMPGGGMEWGESPEQTALRELEEETGLHARIGPILGVYSRWFGAGHPVNGEPGHVIGVVYRATEVTGTLRRSFDPEDTTDAVEWFSLAEARAVPRADLVDFVLARVE